MNPSKKVPEGAKTVNAEGKDLSQAIAAAAEALSIDAERVEYKLDLSHFRSASGGMMASRTVAVVAWETSKSEDELAKPAKKARAPRKSEDDSSEEKRERKPRARRDDGDGESRERKPRSRRDDGDDDSRERKPRSRGRREDEGGERRERKPRDKTPVDDPSMEETDASKVAHAWFATLMVHMGIEAEIKASGNDERVLIWVKADKAGRLIGKRGSTLGSIRHLLGLIIGKEFGDLTIDVDVADNRSKDDDRGERRERKPRSRRDRGDRGGDRDGGSRERRYPEEKIKALARRAAEKALETGKTITINLELNSYDRRLVHVEVAEVDGVVSNSEEREDGTKVIQVAPE